VYWLQRPPYLRWAWDLRSLPTRPYPFAARAIEAGLALSADDVEWREIPAGVMTPPSLDGVVAAVDVGAGEPITDGMLSEPTVVPDGWVALPIDVGAHATPGAEVNLIIVDPPASVHGIVVRSQTGDPYSLDFVPAVVAVPADQAAVAAAAAARGQLVAAIVP
jgi:hypothetical protein